MAEMLKSAVPTFEATFTPPPPPKHSFPSLPQTTVTGKVRSLLSRKSPISIWSRRCSSGSMSIISDRSDPRKILDLPAGLTVKTPRFPALMHIALTSITPSQISCQLAVLEGGRFGGTVMLK